MSKTINMNRVADMIKRDRSNAYRWLRRFKVKPVGRVGCETHYAVADIKQLKQKMKQYLNGNSNA